MQVGYISAEKLEKSASDLKQQFEKIKTAAGSGAANAKYLDSIPPAKKAKILKHIAKHYGVSVREIEKELVDRDAENLFEYDALKASWASPPERSMAMEIYNDFKQMRLMASKTAGFKADIPSGADAALKKAYQIAGAAYVKALFKHLGTQSVAFVDAWDAAYGDKPIEEYVPYAMEQKYTRQGWRGWHNISKQVTKEIAGWLGGIVAHQFKLASVSPVLPEPSTKTASGKPRAEIHTRGSGALNGEMTLWLFMSIEVFKSPPPTGSYTTTTILTRDQNRLKKVVDKAKKALAGMKRVSLGKLVDTGASGPTLQTSPNEVWSSISLGDVAKLKDGGEGMEISGQKSDLIGLDAAIPDIIKALEGIGIPVQVK